MLLGGGIMQEEENKHYQIKKQYDYLDALKTLAIIFVCSYHFSWVGDILYNADGMSGILFFKRFVFGVLSSCMPIFFMVNGALLLSKEELNYKKHLRKIIKLLFQTWLWRALTILIISYAKGISIFSYKRSELFNTVFLFGDVENIDFAHFWFMTTLICIYIIYPLIFSTFRANQISVVIGFLSMMFITVFFVYDSKYLWIHIPYFEKMNIVGFSSLNPFTGLVGCMLFYFVLGWLFHQYKEKMDSIPYFILCIMLVLGAGMLFGEWYMISSTLETNWDNVFGGYYTIANLLISTAIYIITYKLYRNISSKSKIVKVIRLIGKNTLSVYFVHWIIGYTVLDYIHKIFFFEKKGLIINFVKAILVVLIISIVSELLKKLKIFLCNKVFKK